MVTISGLWQNPRSKECKHLQCKCRESECKSYCVIREQVRWITVWMMRSHSSGHRDFYISVPACHIFFLNGKASLKFCESIVCYCPWGVFFFSCVFSFKFDFLIQIKHTALWDCTTHTVYFLLFLKKVLHKFSKQCSFCASVVSHWPPAKVIHVKLESDLSKTG